MRAKLAAAFGAGLALLAGCSTDPAVIAGISDTEVTIRQSSGTPDEAVIAEASEGCALYGKTAAPINYTCSSDGCRTKFHLFACTAPAAATAPATAPALATAPAAAGAPVPLIGTADAPRSTAAALSVEPSRSAVARPAAPPDDDFWDRPFNGPVVVRTPDAALPAAEPPPADFFADACSEYLNDQAMHLRCQIVTGPDRDQYVPPAGWSAPLADQMRCHPLREDPIGYATCLHRRS